MGRRLAPILVKTCQAASWKTEKKLTAKENLLALLNKTEELIKTLRTGRLAPKKHLEGKGKLQRIFEETGLTVAGTELMQTALRARWADEKVKSLEKKSDAEILRELLKLCQNTPKLRAKSQNYEAAWPEVESTYFAKMSLLRNELARREA